jgi:hypothetical protein
LLEVFVDLSAAAEQNCAPVFSFRIVSAEAGWVRAVMAERGTPLAVGSLLGLVTTEAGELAEDGAVARPLRVSVGVILEDWERGSGSAELR